MRVLSSFTLGGPNRRSELTVIDQLLELGDGGLAISEAAAGVERAFRGLAPGGADHTPAPRAGATRPADGLGLLYAGTAVALQRLASHPVAEAGTSPESGDGQCRAWFEYEEPETGERAGELALQLFDFLLGTDGRPEPGALERWHRQVDEFVHEARPRAMPADARAVFDAARRRDIPCFRMDRPPYQPITGGFRVRSNALFRLGHGHRQHTVDGTFCVDLSEPAHALIRDRRKLYQRLESLHVPLPSGRHAPRWCLSADRAARVAEQRGYRVAVRALRRDAGGDLARGLRDPDAVRAAASAALQSGDAVLVEPFVAGRVFRLVVAGMRLLNALEAISADDYRRHRQLAMAEVHPTVRQLCERIAADLHVGMAVVTVVAPTLRSPLEQSGGAVVDVDVAPRLDQLYAHGEPILPSAAEAFLDWMFPKPARARIPIAAITGTNGKTTTCRMLTHILARAGHRTGMACSDGSYVAGKRVSQFEDGYLPGHLTVLDNPEVEAAVLESTRGGAGSTGLGFDRCHVAACLNVTPDHLNDVVGIRTLEQMAELKRWIVERAREAVVLNADDPRCLAMARHMADRRVGLVSLELPGDGLLGQAGPGGLACVAESVADETWLVLYEGKRRMPITRTDDVPVTFGGRARHNVSNALHAAAAAHFMGVAPSIIAAGLSELQGTFDSLPGRLTFHPGLPFDVVMDYAHNPDGIRHVSDFTDRFPVRGRRILALSCAAHNSDAFIRDTAAAAAGHFDHYICKNFGNLFGREPDDCPRLLRDGLESTGVAPLDITCIPDEFEAVRAALAMGREGDLVLILAGKRKQAIWDIITSFKAD